MERIRQPNKAKLVLEKETIFQFKLFFSLKEPDIKTLYKTTQKSLMLDAHIFKQCFSRNRNIESGNKSAYI